MVKTLQTMSANVDKWIRMSAFIMIGVVAGSSAVLSWSGLAYLGQQAQIPYVLSFLLPLSIDGMILLGGTVIIHSTLSNQKTFFGWFMTFLGVVLSIWGNIASVSAHDLQSQIVHSIPPLALFLSLEGLLRIIRHRITTTQAIAMAKAQEEARVAEQKALEASVTNVAIAPKASKREKPARKDSDTKVAGSTRSRVSDQDPEVAIYGLVLESLLALDPTASKVGQVEAILREFPDARTVHIGLAMQVDSRTLGTSVQRAKTKIAKEKDGLVAKESVQAPVGVLAMG